jgi:thiamine pyrophosphate-dependent acetolactate synthase large subunit-like protein
MKESNTLAARLETAFRLVTSKFPTPVQLKILQDIYEEQLSVYEKSPSSAKALFSVGEGKHGETFPIEKHAALTVTCLGIFNLDQSLTRE